MNTLIAALIFFAVSMAILFSAMFSIPRWSRNKSVWDDERPSKQEPQRLKQKSQYIKQFKRDIKIELIVATAIALSTSAMFFAEMAFMGLLYGVIIGSLLAVLPLIAITRHENELKLTKVTVGKLIVGATIVVVILVVVGGWGGLFTAQHFNSELQQMPGSALFANDTLPTDRIPIVSEQYASYLATSHLSDFGGNVQIVDNEMIVSNNTPYWIFSVAPTNVFAVDHLMGFVLVNAVTGNYTDVFQNSTIANGLWFLHDVGFNVYINNVQYTIGNWYPQPAPNGQIDYVVTFDSYHANGVTSFGGGEVLSPNGAVIARWTGLSGYPAWVNQPWDKTLLPTLASTWAGDRTGQNSFGFFAGGFVWIKASRWMMQLDNGAELIPYENGTAFMQFLSPANNGNGLAGVLLATGGRVQFYNMEGLGMISSAAAKATVQSKLPALSGANYSTANPVLYPIGKYYAWIVPYYSTEAITSIVQLQGIGIVDAMNSAHFVTIQSQYGSVTSTGVTTMMANAVEKFLGTVVSNTTSSANVTTVSGYIGARVTFDQNGTTIVGIEMYANDNATFIATQGVWYYGSAAMLNDTEMTDLLMQQVPSYVLTTLEINGNQIVGVIS